MLKIHYHETGPTITGDEALLEKAQLGTSKVGPILEITDVSVNAHSLYTLYNKAEYTPIYEEVDGERVLVEYLEAKRYVTLREKFLEMMEL
ncbi:hypothetical protein JOC25_000020 [Solibacillus kalamii]|uniref:Uncharacterized protein n=1 Tax=Solibacillus kalamii TaxID=1748298 RepID=A0ABX3ZHH2_9BACL|nr:hypothetical protein [Solibacillus kalamii]MBM7663564.1 hypothetical protein [Solibacillus kalamii]OUZ39173.1 hypothetical protein CBM15_09950 [Solibacillus kalamii]